MQIDERTRHEMYERLEEVLGAVTADALMAHLPPEGWADVARKADLDQLETRLDAKFEGLESKVDAKLSRLESHLVSSLGDKIDALHRTLIGALVAAVVAMGGVALAAGHLGG